MRRSWLAVVLVGSALNIGSVVAAPQDRPDPATGRAIPGMAVTAWYHGKIDRAALPDRQLFHSQCWKHIESECAADSQARFTVHCLGERALIEVLEHHDAALAHAIAHHAADWIFRTAAEHVPPAYRDSFLHRNPFNAFLLGKVRE